MPAPRIALVTDWITDMGGVARVDLAILNAFPDADIFTSVYEPDTQLAELYSLYKRFKIVPNASRQSIS